MGSGSARRGRSGWLEAMGVRMGALVAVVLVVTLAGGPPRMARAEDGARASELAESLDPSGYWVDDARLGHVWRPYVGWDWRPYVEGRWIWTSFGWTWVSDEPWTWTFHYGRWGWSSLYGWVWTPGDVWSPAWVDWDFGDGYVGWTPLGSPAERWIYVHDSHFCAPSVATVVVSESLLPDVVRRHREGGVRHREAPPLRDIELVSRHPVRREEDRPGGSIAPWVQRRLARGEPVRERLVDRDGERVLDHERRGPEHREPPAISDDGGWRRAREPDRGVADHDRSEPATRVLPEAAQPAETRCGPRPAGIDVPLHCEGGRWVVDPPSRSSDGAEGRWSRPPATPSEPPKAVEHARPVEEGHGAKIVDRGPAAHHEGAGAKPAEPNDDHRDWGQGHRRAWSDTER